MDVDRISISLSEKLLDEFDKIILKKGYVSRSEAIRDAIRDYIIKHQWIYSLDGERTGAITIIYNHHTNELTNKLIEIQHENKDLIMATLHIHLNHDHCMEVIIVKGEAKRIREFTDKLTSQKGVKNVKLTVMVIGESIPE